MQGEASIISREGVLMDGIDAVGDVVTGGMLARAVEPGAGEAGADGYTHEKNCLNCATKLTGPYCSACGQKAHVHRSVRGFLQDFVAGLFNFEGKIWRTLPMLAWHPGEMTRRYIAGERARFISPVALYLFTVFAMFAVLNFNGELGTHTSSKLKGGLKAEMADQRRQLAALELKRKLTLSAGKPVTDLDRRIAKRQQDITETQKVLDGAPAVQTKLDDETPSFIRPFIENAQANPDQVSTRVQDAASKYSWLLIPLSVPFMWLLFPLRRRYNTYDHMVFVTYSLSFMMMLVIAGGGLVAIGMTTLASMLFFVPPFHMYRHLKESYELGRTSAILRTMALVTFAFIAAALFAAATVAIGAS